MGGKWYALKVDGSVACKKHTWRGAQAGTGTGVDRARGRGEERAATVVEGEADEAWLTGIDGVAVGLVGGACAGASRLISLPTNAYNSDREGITLISL